MRRRATVLPENVSWTDRDGPTGQWAPVVGTGTLIFDPDPALLRAALLDGFALEHGLGRIADGVDYLTGERLISTPLLTAFVRAGCAAAGSQAAEAADCRTKIGTLEIKVRGADVTPEVCGVSWIFAARSRPACLFSVDRGRCARFWLTGDTVEPDMSDPNTPNLHLITCKPGRGNYDATLHSPTVSAGACRATVALTA